MPLLAVDPASQRSCVAASTPRLNQALRHTIRWDAPAEPSRRDTTIGGVLDRPEVAREVIKVFTLSAPASRLLRPRIVLATLPGPRRPVIDTPPFTAAERAALGSR